ncbi:MAG: metal-dependent transcriptional regulator [Ignavibacteria bacterium]|nr:metal-dependent transcriptional regulator [Ignavibacteria bacterium]
MKALSHNIEDYLKAIYLLTRAEAASTSDIASQLDVSPASVTGMLKKLDDAGLVRYESYKGVTLTHAGRKVALEIIRHHRLIETYLAEALGYGWDQVHEEAERLEHHISEDFEDRIAKVLGDPMYDPHGDPIPSKEGKMPPDVSDRLSDADVNDTVIVRRVASHDSELLRRLSEQGITLGTQMKVVLRNENEKILTVKVGRAPIELKFSWCENIFIQRS